MGKPTYLPTYIHTYISEGGGRLGEVSSFTTKAQHFNIFTVGIFE